VIDNIIKLIELIPDLFIYLAVGYVFLKVYEFVRANETSIEYGQTIFRSIVCSYVIKTIFDLVTNDLFTSNTAYTPLLLLFAVVLGYVSALVIKSKGLEAFLLSTKTNRTVNKNIWIDIFSVDGDVRLYTNDGKYIYEGCFETCEEDTREPLIVLKRYQKKKIEDEKEMIIVDYTDDDKQMIVINTKDIGVIEMTERK